jgi:ubiquinone biosynthesis protein COQ4
MAQERIDLSAAGGYATAELQLSAERSAFGKKRSVPFRVHYPLAGENHAVVVISHGAGGDIDTPHPVAWMARRTRDVHDLWHILTGYGRDGLGEACLVAFSYPQTRSLGWALIAMGAISRTRGGRYPYARAILQGYQRGKAAKWLLGEDYEALLAEPLDGARRRLGITPPTIYDAIPPEARDIVPAV